MEKIKYQVCIRCFTYNQSLYILDALNSFVMQKTSFPFVILVVDDASTDGEPEIIRKFVYDNFDVNDKNISYEKQSDLAKTIYAQHSTNKNCYIAAVFLKQNLYGTGKKTPIANEWRDQARYEALCEGDDWWLTNDKLQKQFDILEAHPEVDMCACGALRMKEGKEIGKVQPSPQERILTTEETILGGGGFLATNSLMQRTSLFHDEYKFWQHMGLDLFYQIHGSLKGGIYFSPEFMAAYRVSANGSWSQNMAKQKEKKFFHIANVQETLRILNKETHQKYDTEIKQKLYKNYLSMFTLGLSSGLFDETLKTYNLKKRINVTLKLLKRLL